MTNERIVNVACAIIIPQASDLSSNIPMISLDKYPEALPYENITATEERSAGRRKGDTVAVGQDRRAYAPMEVRVRALDGEKKCAVVTILE
jgi:hypothetical protein